MSIKSIIFMPMQKKIANTLFCIFVILQTFAQTTNNTNINLNVGGKSFKQIIQNMENTNKVSFSYSDDILPTHKLPNRQFNNSTITHILDEVFVPYGIDYLIKGDKIILFKSDNIPQYNVSGFLRQSNNRQTIISALVYSSNNQAVSVSNAYGFYSLKLNAGFHTINVNCLGYKPKTINIHVWNNTRFDITLEPTSYSVSEVVINSSAISDNVFLESADNQKVNINIKTLKHLPGFFGENDALRNLNLIAGVQTNEISTGSIFVRGGTTEQTLFLMDEATIYNPSHFFGLFSVFNPDVIKHISVYKNQMPNNETEALSSVIDVRLREGDMQKWRISGGMGILSARLAIEGPIVKDKSSVLVSFRRSFVDRIFKTIATTNAMKKLRFFFYDGNVKFNYKLNTRNRIFLSGYMGTDEFSQYNKIKRHNRLATFRWNHIYGNNMFSNTSAIYSTNYYKQQIFANDEEINWKSKIENFKVKSDFSYNLRKNIKFNYGYSFSLFNIMPYIYTASSDKDKTRREKAVGEQLMINNIYINNTSTLLNLIKLDLGVSLLHIYNSPFIERENKYQTLLFEPNIKLSYLLNKQNHFDLTYNQKHQSLHQLYLNRIGISVNRYQPSSEEFKPQVSNNFSFGFSNSNIKNTQITTSIYYRDMRNLIETMQELRILYSNQPEKYFRHSSGKVYGLELSAVYQTEKIKTILAYDYNKVLWTTEGINNNKPYPASHARKHNFSISGIWKINKRLTFSSAWIWASGTPYTAATGKYEIDGKVYVKYDNENVNSCQLPNYHRLDLSLEIKAKHNETKRWQSFWNFSIYNVYFHKNILGVSYFNTNKSIFTIRNKKQIDDTKMIKPQFFYLYQFVPSISYHFKF